MNTDVRSIIQNEVATYVKTLLLNKNFKHFKGRNVTVTNIAVSVDKDPNECLITIIYNDIDNPDAMWACTFEHFISTVNPKEKILRFEPIDDSDLKDQMLNRSFTVIPDEKTAGLLFSRYYNV